VTACLTCEPALRFDLGPELIATTPPEHRHVARDEVRMLIASADGIEDRRAGDLPDVLRVGDVLVVNDSQTLPASLPGRTADGTAVEVHFSTVLPASGDTPAAALSATRSRWLVELRRPAPGGSRPSPANHAGAAVTASGGAQLRVGGPHAAGQASGATTPLRLWEATVCTPRPLLEHLEAFGEPIRYGYVAAPWPIAAYRTAVGVVPGSAEMPSAGRPLTGRLLRRLAEKGVQVERITLHCGVSSGEAGEPPYAEWLSVPERTAETVSRARRDGRRVIAVGTTVVRALESAGDGRGGVRPAQGWTDLVVTPERGVDTVDGILTGWHEPEASHLAMLEAVAGRSLLCESYRAALDRGYLWHEFGDVHLLLPGTRR
jgi:S-adenosylmethionine:tRNA ribosyltransferase-isomerase